MTEKEERQKAVLRRIRMTAQNETICLADWEVRLLIGYIDSLKSKLKKAEEMKHE